MTTPKTPRIPWKVILQEYLSDPTTYICHGSPTFKKYWIDPVTFPYICQRARKWAQKVGLSLDNFNTGAVQTGSETLCWCLPSHTKLRFLHHCAQVKYIKPTTPPTP